MTIFFTAKAASAYVGNINNGTYKLTNASYGSGGAYEQAFGHSPSTFAEYRKDEGPVGYFIWQFDQFMQVGSLTRTYARDAAFVTIPQVHFKRLRCAA